MLAARLSWVGPSFLSTIRQETPCRFSSAAMNRPTGPAPTTNTWVPVATRYPKTPRLPHISHCARASVVERDANSPSNLLSSVTPLARRNSAPAEASAESFTGKRTVDDKARSGKRLEHRRQRRIAHPVVRPGDRPRNASTAWNRPPELGASYRSLGATVSFDSWPSRVSFVWTCNNLT